MDYIILMDYMDTLYSLHYIDESGMNASMEIVKQILVLSMTQMINNRWIIFYLKLQKKKLKCKIYINKNSYNYTIQNFNELPSGYISQETFSGLRWL